MKNIERIAISLERIAAALEAQTRNRAIRIQSVSASKFTNALRLNSHKLKGRMSVTEISAAIGIPVTRSDNVAIGLALTEVGARKGKSGSARYYVFD